jgi:hypothetical protein
VLKDTTRDVESGTEVGGTLWQSLAPQRLHSSETLGGEKLGIGVAEGEQLDVGTSTSPPRHWGGNMLFGNRNVGSESSDRQKMAALPASDRFAARQALTVGRVETTQTRDSLLGSAWRFTTLVVAGVITSHGWALQNFVRSPRHAVSVWASVGWTESTFVYRYAAVARSR